MSPPSRFAHLYAKEQGCGGSLDFSKTKRRRFPQGFCEAEGQEQEREPQLLQFPETGASAGFNKNKEPIEPRFHNYGGPRKDFYLSYINI
jgi:hypothetical protein